jgi:hypothetical protein
MEDLWIMPDIIDPYERRAAFAAQFQGTTNLDQRRRFAQDISTAKDRAEERAQIEFEQAQRANPKLMTAVTGRIKEQRMGEEWFQKANLAERRFQLDTSKAITAEDLANQRLSIAKSAEERALKTQALTLQQKEDAEQDAFNMRELEYKLRKDPSTPPGSEAYKQRMLNGLLTFRSINKEDRNVILKQIGYEDPEMAWKNAVDFASKNPNARVSVPIGGGVRATIPPKAESKEIDVDKEMLRVAAMKERAVDPEFKALIDQRLTDLKAMKVGQTPQIAPANKPMTFTNDPEGLKKAVENAAPGSVFTYNGKQYKKPESK